MRWVWAAEGPLAAAHGLETSTGGDRCTGALTSMPHLLLQRAASLGVEKAKTICQLHTRCVLGRERATPFVYGSGGWPGLVGMQRVHSQRQRCTKDPLPQHDDTVKREKDGSCSSFAEHLSACHGRPSHLGWRRAAQDVAVIGNYHKQVRGMDWRGKSVGGQVICQCLTPQQPSTGRVACPHQYLRIETDALLLKAATTKYIGALGSDCAGQHATEAQPIANGMPDLSLVRHPGQPPPWLPPLH